MVTPLQPNRFLLRALSAGHSDKLSQGRCKGLPAWYGCDDIWIPGVELR